MIAVCSPLRTDYHPWTARCVTALTDALEEAGHKVTRYVVAGREVADARNALTALAMNHRDLTHVLWIDGDMTFPADAAERLFVRERVLRAACQDRVILSGLYHLRRPPWDAMLAFEQTHLGPAGVPQRKPRVPGFYWRSDLASGSGLLQVHGTGAGFLLTPRAALEAALAQATREGPEGPEGPEGGLGPWSPLGDLGEDFSFMIRARAAGWEVYVDLDLDLGHLGEVVIDRATAAALRKGRALGAGGKG